MSEIDRSPPPVPPPPRRTGCMTAFLTAVMILFGIILLLPGLCALLFGGISLTQSAHITGLVPLIVGGLLLGAGGVILIWAAVRGLRS